EGGGGGGGGGVGYGVEDVGGGIIGGGGRAEDEAVLKLHGGKVSSWGSSIEAAAAPSPYANGFSFFFEKVTKKEEEEEMAELIDSIRGFWLLVGIAGLGHRRDLGAETADVFNFCSISMAALIDWGGSQRA
ncbi:hypothetical protein CRG98_049930, partial [Punica granatum]